MDQDKTLHDGGLNCCCEIIIDKPIFGTLELLD